MPLKPPQTNHSRSTLDNNRDNDSDYVFNCLRAYFNIRIIISSHQKLNRKSVGVSTYTYTIHPTKSGSVDY